jgi:benzoyl-CoA reductase/2-hydroxyglutaryl-CoA dehydratase subunit BcrC/BadD/HgdB
MKKQTAVEWLIDELRNQAEQGTLTAISISELKMIAKEMECAQIIKAFNDSKIGLVAVDRREDYWMPVETGTEYYNEKYK